MNYLCINKEKKNRFCKKYAVNQMKKSNTFIFALYHSLEISLLLSTCCLIVLLFLETVDPNITWEDINKCMRLMTLLLMSSGFFCWCMVREYSFDYMIRKKEKVFIDDETFTYIFHEKVEAYKKKLKIVYAIKYCDIKALLFDKKSNELKIEGKCIQSVYYNDLLLYEDTYESFAMLPAYKVDILTNIKEKMNK